jgi:hypothetical protein
MALGRHAGSGAAIRLVHFGAPATGPNKAGRLVGRGIVARSRLNRCFPTSFASLETMCAALHFPGISWPPRLQECANRDRRDSGRLGPSTTGAPLALDKFSDWVLAVCGVGGAQCASAHENRSADESRLRAGGWRARRRGGNRALG